MIAEEPIIVAIEDEELMNRALRMQGRERHYHRLEELAVELDRAMSASADPLRVSNLRVNIESNLEGLRRLLLGELADRKD